MDVYIRFIKHAPLINQGLIWFLELVTDLIVRQAYQLRDIQNIIREQKATRSNISNFLTSTKVLVKIKFSKICEATNLKERLDTFSWN